ncbi:MAG: response regulator [Deltaproteobacteria bacterium]|nr:response regulator [Deltaproteobacteria bacterium]
MRVQSRINPLRLLLAALLPLAAFILQSIFWAAIRPFAWFLFFPAVFFSSWIGGMAGGVIATLIATLLAWWFFIPPENSFALEDPFTLGSIGLFMVMGVLFGYSQERVRRANRQTAEALAAARAANEQLQGANERITQLYEKTLEVDQLKTRFFANVSHELRTPLTLILGPVTRRLAAGNLVPAEQQELQVVERNARLLYRHVSDLLDVSKLDAGRMQMEYARTDLAALARFVASHFEVLAAEKQIRFTVDTIDVLPGQVDTAKCQRVLLNLLSNAFKFTPDHGAITLSLATMENRAVIRVQDNGPGVPAALREAVFERFQQGESDADRRFGGTGLGLAIVREFVKLHNGEVTVGAAPGGGALFTVSLPLAAPAGVEIRSVSAKLDAEIDRQAMEELRGRPPLATPAAGTAVAVDAPLVLVVEDNPDMNDFVAMALGQTYRVATAFDGREGLAKALSLRPDLIVSDVMMPHLSGDRMVEELRRHPELNDVPIVMLTAKADDELRVKLLKEGVQDYINKPFSTEELLARAGVLITGRQRTMQELLRLNADLERRVEARTIELTAANRELESFAYAVSHDLRAPLRAMTGFSQALLEDYASRLDGEAKVFLEQITIAVRKMGELIDGLLILSRCTRGELRHDRLDLSALAAAILDELALTEPGRTVARQIEPRLAASGDERMIGVVLRNLLGNAWKYTAKTAEPLIRIYTEQQGDEHFFCVADNGAGFDMGHADKLFQPFQRLHRQDEFPGLGIGLATAQRIIHRHGGELRAVAEPGRGAIFSFSLPPAAGDQGGT